MAQHPLARVVRRFKRESSRTGSLIITFYGDAILPRGGSVWLSTLLQFLALLEIDGGVVRTAVSRLAADGWFDRDKVGRNSFYRLAKGGRARFEVRRLGRDNAPGAVIASGVWALQGADSDATPT